MFPIESIHFMDISRVSSDDVSDIQRNKFNRRCIGLNLQYLKTVTSLEQETPKTSES